MNVRASVRWLFCACAPLAWVAAYAQLPIQHRAHVHGATIVDVVQDGRDLTLAFEVSGLDAVGFEHTPRSDTERSEANAALTILQSPDEWLVPNVDAQCRRTFIGVTPNIFRSSDEDEQQKAGKASRRDEYADIGAQYSFTCDAPQRLRALEFDLIERFPKLRAIIVNLTASGGQSQTVITTPRAQITFTATSADD